MADLGTALVPEHAVAESWRDYLTLCKPRVVALMIVTALVGMYLASPHLVPWQRLLAATTGIALAAGAAAAVNHLVDRKIDAVMARTQYRPLPTGRVSPAKAWCFAAIIGVSGMLILVLWVNVLTAALTFLALIGYAGVYTLYLKRATPQNIVIGGAAGAAPPLLGWVAVTGHMDPEPWLLVLIIFVWTAPHFWALAIHRYKEYAAADIPMLPVTHGVAFTKRCVLLYTLLLVAVSLLPYAYGMSTLKYVAGVMVLNGGFLYWAAILCFSQPS